MSFTAPFGALGRRTAATLSAVALGTTLLVSTSTQAGAAPSPALASSAATSTPMAGTARTEDPVESLARRRLATRRQIALATPGNFTGYGFDQCVAPTQKAMDRWWNTSPFTAVGIYVSGDSRGCRNQPNLDATWVATQVARGWRLLPIALGPQASCHPSFPRYRDDFTISPRPAGGYSRAARQGRAEADKNAADALAYGIGSGSTLWYDLEGFDLRNTHCRESAMVFVSNWVKQIRTHGYVAGFYSSASSGIKMLDDARRLRPGRFHLPDRIWIARWDGIADTSTSYIPEDGWRPGGRMKQYLGDHDETWGGVRINIDSNFIDLGAGSRKVRDTQCPSARLAFPSYPTLSPESALPGRVKALQCLLTQQGAYAGPIDGQYGAATIAAVRTWQERRRFTPEDAFTQRHWVALFATGPGTVLKRGSNGAAAHRLQRALKAAGAGRFRANGVLDARTEAALRVYQRRVGIPVSGSATPQTWNRLRRGQG